MSKMQQEIGKKVEEKIKKAHEEHMLREQLKVIKKQLGMEKDDKECVQNVISVYFVFRTI